jgi:3'5'-cyclic nucleotide phosphodiesterase
MDKDLKNIRNTRWTKAFAYEPTETNDNNLSQKDVFDQVNRKATIVIEHMIQASDVSHTMQHWHIYRKWNQLFYFECYDAYSNGRAMVDPTDTWYQGELDFYDYYIIPLAKKLKECGVFGVSSTEYLQYALSNRSEWQSRGKEIVAEMKAQVMALKQLEITGDESK